MRAALPSDAILDRLLGLHPKLIDLTLDRVWRLLAAMGHPERHLPPVIHIAGTNGKGSTQAMIAAGLGYAGHRVHAYTSPHLARFHERICLAGRLIEEKALADLLEECETANGGAPITFFEITTVAAFVAFARMPADFTLLEVGLGGRLDATNVIDRPRLCIITPVSIDHQQYLGDSLAQIAAEKAGILKAGVPCIVGPQPDIARAVIEEHAARIGAPLLVHGQDWHVHAENGRVVYQDDSRLLDLDPPRLLGAHQIENAGMAVAALLHLDQPEDACHHALRDVRWPARMQRLVSGPLCDALPSGAQLWLDGGHNGAAGVALGALLQEMQSRDPRPTWLLCGMLDTKAAGDYLRPLAPHCAGVYTVEIPGAEASFSAEALAKTAREAGFSHVAPAGSAQDAMAGIARKLDGAPGRVLICGSLYLAGSILHDHH